MHAVQNDTTIYAQTQLLLLLLRILRYNASEGSVSNDFSRHLLDDSQTSYFDKGAWPILECHRIVSCTQLFLQTVQVATVYSIHKQSQSLSWCSIGLVTSVIPWRNDGSGKPCAVELASEIIGKHSDLNQGPPGPKSRVVTTILPLHTYESKHYRTTKATASPEYKSTLLTYAGWQVLLELWAHAMLTYQQ